MKHGAIDPALYAGLRVVAGEEVLGALVGAEAA